MAKKSNKGKGSNKGSKKNNAAPAATTSAAPVKAAAPTGPTLFVLLGSANSHGCLILNTENKLNYNIKPLDAAKGETRAPEFVAKNPFHCCPSLEDGELMMWESHAVMRYLCNKHKLDQWYPQSDVDARGKVDQALDWRHCSLYPNLAKCCYAPLGFGVPNPAKEAEGVAGVKEQLEMMEKHYLKEGKFLTGCATPTIADLSVRPALTFLKIIDYKFTKPIQAYMDRFDKAVPSYKEIAAGLEGYIASKKNPVAPGPAGPKLDPKRTKACLKEGGKKGQDLGGMASFGCHYFCTSMDEPNGEMAYLELCMQGANAEVDPEGEDRKGGAGDLGKIFFAAGDKCLAMIAHNPKECQDKVKIMDWFGPVMKSVNATQVGKADDFFVRAEVQGDADKGLFPLKLRDVAIAAGFAYLKEKGLALDDDSDDDIDFTAASGVNLNAGADGSDY